MYRRNITNLILEAFEDTPIILINGARQTGKSTLCQQLLTEGGFDAQLVTMDDPTILLAAERDPLGFLKDLGKHIIIDEVQRTPGIFLPLKKLIDQDRKGYRVILTGSANVMTLPKVGDSLAGRIEVHALWPLSQDEMSGPRSRFLEILTQPEGKFQPAHTDWTEIANRIRTGGYPEPVSRSATARRNRWFANYMGAVLQKDIRELANIEGLTEIPNVLRLIATRVGSTINLSDIARLSGIKNTTLRRYITLLEHTFLTVKIPAWTKNLEGQLVKTPKVYLNDTGLLHYLIGQEGNAFLDQRANAGPFLENFVVMEIIKQLSWSALSLKPYHFSIHKGSEVDLVLEDQLGGLFGIEIKSAASLHDHHFNGLRRLAEIAGDRFRRGIVLYSGDQVLGGFGEKLQAVPLSALWS